MWMRKHSRHCHWGELDVGIFWQEFYLFIFIIVVQLQFSHIFTCCCPLPLPPESILTPLSVPMGPLFMSLDLPLPLLSSFILLPPPLITVSLAFTSVSLVLFCYFVYFVDQVPLISEIMWYLSLTTWLSSLSIMLSSSIHAVAKGISSFFLSAA